MSADVSSCHGGDGGGQDPPNPTTIPSSCESVAPLKRKGRGPAAGKNLDDRRREAGHPLPIVVDPITYKVVGTEHAAFVRLLGTQVTSAVPGYYKDWTSVPKRYKDNVISKVKHIYQIDGRPDYTTLIDSIDAEMSERYRDRKSKRHTHFKKFYKGPDDWDEVLKNPPKDVNADEWKQICEFFRSPEFIARSVKNKINRDQMKYSTTQGTKSLAATRHEKLNPNLIEEWKEYHWTKKNKSFVNEDAERDYVKLKSTLEAETQQTVESGTDDSSSVDQMKILSQVLGERRGHQRGVGRTLKGKSLTRPSQRSQSQAPPQQPTEEIRELVDIVKVINEQLQYVCQQLPPEKRPTTNVDIQNTYQRFFEKYVGSSSETQTQHTSQASASRPSPGHPDTSAPNFPSQPSANPYMYQWPMPPYPQAYHPHMGGPSSQPSPPHMSGSVSQPPPYPYPYPYIYGPGGSSLPPQYPWSMPPHTPQAPQPPPPQPQAPEEGDNTDDVDG